MTLARRRAIIQTDFPVAWNGRRRNLHVPTTCNCPLYIVGIHETAVASADVSNDYSVWTLCAISVSAAVVKTVVIHSVLTDQGSGLAARFTASLSRCRQCLRITLSARTLVRQ